MTDTGTGKRATENVDAQVPENLDAPCNICGRGWPYHAEACAYKQAHLENQRLRVALEDLIDVCERIRGGDPKLDPEEWYAARDFAISLTSRSVRRNGASQSSNPESVGG